MPDELEASPVSPSPRWPLFALRSSPFTSRFSLLTLLLAALAAVPLFSNTGFLSTRNVGESQFLLLRLHQLLVALQSGQFPARWMPDAAYGYGFPFFSYYASLPYYFAALLKLYGFSFVLSLKLTQLIALLGAAAGMYVWARALGLSPAPAALASAAYSFAPFHLVNLYVRGDSLSELWAMTWYPLALWRAHSAFTRPSLRNAARLALLIAALICTHNISALTFLPFLALYLLWGALRSSPFALRLSLLALLLALSLSAFFWLPALGETSAVQIGGVTSDFFFYGQHFRSLDLIQPALFFDYDSAPFSMGLMQTLALAGGLLALLFRRRWTWADGFALTGLALSTFMLTPASAWLWEHLPLLKFAQFPWRFLSIQSLFVALLTAPLLDFGFEILDFRFGIWRLGFGILLLAFPVFSLGALRPDFIPLTDADVTPQRLQLYEAFTANLGSTIGAEYLPREVQPRPYIGPALLGRLPALKVLSGTAVGAQNWKRGADEQWTVNVSSETATLAVPTFYWPGWQAQSDGHPLPVRPADSLGWLTVDVPRGAHTLTFHLGRTPLRAIAETISLLALLAVALIFAREENWRIRDWRIGFWILGFGIFGAVLLRLVPPSTASASPLSMDFTQLAYPHHAPVRFTDGTQLTAVQYSAEHLRPGETFTVRTEWDGAGQATFSLASLANLLLPVDASLALGTFAVAPTVDFTATFPADWPPGIYFVIVEHSSGPALTSAGRARGPVHLAPLWLDSTIAESAESLNLQSLIFHSSNHLSLFWRAPASLPRNYPMALRLRDVSGNEWAALDIQTGGGFYPTSLWQPGELISDTYALPLPEGAPPGAYPLTVALYDPLTRAAIFETTVAVTLTTASPLGAHTAQFALTPELALERVDFPAQVTQGDAPELAAHWLALAAPPRNYRARWIFVNAAGQESAAQTLDLAAGSAPQNWPAQSYVLGRVRLPIAQDLPLGDYSLVVQLMDGETLIGQSPTVGRVTVLGRARNFAVPPLPTEVRATFGEALTLWGYDSTQSAEALTLTLAWGALDAPGRDYKFFVHLFNPADESVPAQADAMPHNFEYPTSLWVKGEVVTDTVTLDLRAVPPGDYRLAVGWYDPSAPEQRLPAFSASGARLDFDRAVLPLRVSIP